MLDQDNMYLSDFHQEEEEKQETDGSGLIKEKQDDQSETAFKSIKKESVN